MSDDTKVAITRKQEHLARVRRINAEKNKVKKAACECFSTDSGKIFLAWLVKECGYQEPSVVLDASSGEIRKEATVYNEAKRDVYLRVRHLLSTRRDILIDVEINEQQGEK